MGVYSEPGQLSLGYGVLTGELVLPIGAGINVGVGIRVGVGVIIDRFVVRVIARKHQRSVPIVSLFVFTLVVFALALQLCIGRFCRVKLHRLQLSFQAGYIRLCLPGAVLRLTLRSFLLLALFTLLGVLPRTLRGLALGTASALASA